MNDAIKSVVEKYLQCDIRSEQEVRSKLIVPLTEALGYAPNTRGEDFPVYSFVGGKKQPTTFADFIMFSDCDFNKHSNFIFEDIEWIHNHSLLVIETKKPDELPNVQGQAQFYAMWARTLAYIVTDGKRIKGWIYKSGCADELIVDCDILSFDDQLSRLSEFEFNTLLQEKEDRIANDNSSLITDPSELNLSSAQIQYMKNALGRNAEGIDNLELTSKFLASCDFILQNNIRYGVPDFALDLLRETYEVNLYTDNNILPVDTGILYYSYWEEIDRYQYDSDYIHFEVSFWNKQIIQYKAYYHSLSSKVFERIIGIKKILQTLESNQMKLVNNDDQSKQVVIDKTCMPGVHDEDAEYISLFEFWLNGLEQMKEIEDYYKVVFNIGEADDIPQLYHDIEMVYNGFHMIENCTLPIPCETLDGDFEITTPTVIREGEIPNMSDKSIFGIVFHPVRTILLPKKYNVSKHKKKMELSVCCVYKKT